ncbi:MAG: hypothetical protein D6780_08210 [Candidatus Dadabacteria bacterium]|nr:MAG: hypothetical protein D6780_08210 [Candidatus Dadabacteria bacterium]
MRGGREIVYSKGQEVRMQERCEGAERMRGAEKGVEERRSRKGKKGAGARIRKRYTGKIRGEG